MPQVLTFPSSFTREEGYHMDHLRYAVDNPLGFSAACISLSLLIGAIGRLVRGVIRDLAAARAALKEHESELRMRELEQATALGVSVNQRAADEVQVHASAQQDQ